METVNVLIIGRFRRCLDVYSILADATGCYDVLAMVTLDEADKSKFDGLVLEVEDLCTSDNSEILLGNSGAEIVVIDDPFYDQIKELLDKLGYEHQMIKWSDAFETFSDGKKEEVDKLCILIPTYNRLKHITDTLVRLDNQTIDKSRYEIIVVDNASKYPLEDLEAAIPDGIRNNTTIVRNAHNIGLAGNVANLFIRSTQKWCWFLADDDMIRENAVETIIRDIERFGSDKLGVIQYLHFDLTGKIPEEYILIDSLKSFNDVFYYLAENDAAPLSYFQGTLVYLANKVFNMEVMDKFVQYAFTYASTIIPHDMPIIKGLETREIQMLQHNMPIIDYAPGRATWDMRAVALGFSTIKYLNLKVSQYELGRLLGLLNISMNEVLYDYCRSGITDTDYLETLYNNAYKHFLSDDEKKFFNKVIELSESGEDILFLRAQYRV